MTHINTIRYGTIALALAWGFSAGALDAAGGPRRRASSSATRSVGKARVGGRSAVRHGGARSRSIGSRHTVARRGGTRSFIGARRGGARATGGRRTVSRAHRATPRASTARRIGKSRVGGRSFSTPRGSTARWGTRSSARSGTVRSSRTTAKLRRPGAGRSGTFTRTPLLRHANPSSVARHKAPARGNATTGLFGGSATGAQHGGIGGTHHGPSVSFSAGLLTDHAVVGIHLGDGHHDTTHGLALGLLGTAHFGHSGLHHGFGHFPHYGYTAYYPYNSYYYSGYDPYYYPSRAYYRYDTYVDRFYDNDLYYADTAVGRGDGYVGAAWYEPPDQEQVVPEPDSTYAAPPSPIQALLEQGHDAFRRGAYEEARSRYVRAILADEAGGVAKLFYGFANVALGDYEQAAVAFRRALIATPELIDTPPDLRDLYRDDDRLTAHITDLAAFFAAHPESRDALFVLGYMHYAAADPVAALDAFTALCDADPSDDVVMLLRHAARRAVRHAAPSP